MKKYLNKFDELIYNASDYRDINYAKSNNIKNINIIYPGASEYEFSKIRSISYRKDIGIKKGSFVFLTVGSPAFHKGHKEIIRSYLLSKLPFSSALVLNGNYSNTELSIKELLLNPKKILREVVLRIIGKSPYNIKQLAKKNNDKKKDVIFSDLSRDSLIQLYFDADLFLFASHIEYSPLVIFECLASGLPFISIPVGNTEEIVNISNGGIICEGKRTKDHRSYVDPKKLSYEISRLSRNKKLLVQLGANGRNAWEKHFTWEIVAENIENLVIINH
jgi:glycosyltransferase involved in cell wall biosynthesis